MMQKSDPITTSLLFLLTGLACLVWYQILFVSSSVYEAAFLDVGQGDSALLSLSHDIVMLVDAGRDRSVEASLGKVLPSGRRYIDVGVITHPEVDHFNGFLYLLRSYAFGAFLINGRMDASAQEAWQEFVSEAKNNHIPIIVIEEGDSVTVGDATIHVLSPDDAWRESGDMNDASIVLHATLPSFSVLLTADIGIDVEEDVLRDGNVRAHVLKAGHHGSRYSSGDAFIEAVRPRIVVVSVGENNYGHPSKEALENFKEHGARVFRTDLDGTVRIREVEGALEVFTEKSR